MMRFARQQKPLKIDFSVYASEHIRVLAKSQWAKNRLAISGFRDLTKTRIRPNTQHRWNS